MRVLEHNRWLESLGELPEFLYREPFGNLLDQIAGPAVLAEIAAWDGLPIRFQGLFAQLTHDGRTLQYVDRTSQADIWVAELD